MIRFTERTPKICDIYNYTYTHKPTHSRFLNADRDVLISKIKISQRKIYNLNKQSLDSVPLEQLIIYSESAPQYRPYSKVKSKNAKKQMKIRHHYDVIMCIQLTDEGTYNFWESKIIWRVGSQKKWQKNVPQNKVKTIYRETRTKLERKYSKLSAQDRKKAIDKEIKKIKTNAPYMDVGDYNSQWLGINGDNYYRDYPLQSAFDCLYGRCYYTDMPKDIEFPFFCKHALYVLNFLMRRGILKYK